MKNAKAILIVGMLFTVATRAQSGFWGHWLERSDQAKADQPRWMTPVVTVTPRVEQEFRSDFVVQPFPDGNPTVNFGNGKGGEFIPSERVEVVVNVPPYLQHNRSGIPDGFGDFSLLGKYRFVARPEDQGNYVFTAFLGATVPTGSYSNGARAGVMTPTIAAGKGWGNFDVQSTLSVGLPTSNTQIIGHAVGWNTAFQYHVSVLWPEVELNSTWWKGGTLDARHQTFVTPGVIVGRLPLYGHLRLAFGGAVQIATTHYHQYGHAYVFTVRLPL